MTGIIEIQLKSILVCYANEQIIWNEIHDVPINIKAIVSC